MKYELTKQSLTSIPSTGSRESYPMKEKGLSLLVSTAGSPSIIFRYQLNGTRRKMALGTFTGDNIKTLQSNFASVSGKVAANLDPLTVRDEEREQREQERHASKSTPTLADASQHYISQYIKRGIGRGGDKEGVPLKRPRDADSLFKNYIDAQPWALRPINKVSNDNIADAITEVAEDGALNTANKLRIFLSGVYKFAKKSPRRWVTRGEVAEVLDDLPTYGTRKRDRVLWSPEDASELRAFITALESASFAPAIKRAIWMLLLGQRRMETVSMTGDEVKRDEHNNHALWWVIEKNKTKNGREHRVFLPDQFRDLPESGYAFPARYNGGHIDASTLSHRVRDVFKAAGIEGAVLHDIRRTVGTFIQAKYGKDIMHVCLNHKSGGLTETYGLYDFDKEKRLAFTAWASELGRIMGTNTAKVVVNF